jgi:ribonucleotide reductase alpha subunit
MSFYDWNEFEEYLIESRYSVRNPNTGDVLEHSYNDILDRIINLLKIDLPIYLKKLSYESDQIKKCVNTIIHYLKQRYLIPATPFLMNYGNTYTRRPGLFSCYPLGWVDDTMDDIWDKCKSMRNIYMYGGGSGIDISKLRAKGLPVDVYQGISSGPIEFLKLFDAVAGSTNQGGRRRGALLVSMDATHPNIYDFIKCKRLNGKLSLFFKTLPENERPAQNPHLSNVNISVNIKEKDFENDYLIQEIAKSIWESGDPGLLFPENMINNGPFHEKDNPVFINPCVPGYIKILTKNGHICIGDLVNTQVDIWNGFEWSNVLIKETGQNQDLLRIVFSDGSMIDCTPYHKFIIKNTYGGKEERKEAKDLLFTDKLVKCKYPIIDGIYTNNLKYIYTQGFYSGDGNIRRNIKQRYDFIWLYGEKKKLLPYLEYFDIKSTRTIRNDTRYGIKILKAKPKDWVPCDQYTIDCKLAWLAGLFDADGTINGPEQNLSLSSINAYFLHQIQLMLLTLNVKSKLNFVHDAQFRNFNGGYPDYWCKPIYRLIISTHNVKQLINLGLNKYLHRIKLNPIKSHHSDTSHYIYPIKIEYLGKIDKVFCFNEPKNHSGIFNGVYCGNCSEVHGPENLSCNLLTINVAKIFIDKYKDKNIPSVQFTSALNKIKDVASSAAILGNLIINYDYGYPDERIKEVSQRFRPIGIGMSGYHTALICSHLIHHDVSTFNQNTNWEYGSLYSLNLINLINSMISVGSLIVSKQFSQQLNQYTDTKLEYWSRHLDKIQDCWKTFNWSFEGYINQSIFTDHILFDYEHLRSHVDTQHTFYNAFTMSQAPTGTVSAFLNNLDTGIEPYFAYETTRRVRDNKDISGWKSFNLGPTYLRELDNYEYILSQLKDQISNNISASDHINILTSAAVLCHTGISKSINVKEETTIDDIKNIIQNTKKAGIKGITIYRNNSLENIITATKPIEIQSNKNILIEDIPDKRQSVTYTAKGQHFTTHITLTIDKEQRVREVFIQAGDIGASINSMFAGLGMAISLALRNNPDYIDSYIKTLQKVKMDDRIVCIVDKDEKPIVGSSVPNVIGQLLQYTKNHICSSYKENTELIKNVSCSTTQADICPVCNQIALKRSGSCFKCESCGYTSC